MSSPTQLCGVLGEAQQYDLLPSCIGRQRCARRCPRTLTNASRRATSFSNVTKKCSWGVESTGSETGRGPCRCTAPAAGRRVPRGVDSCKGNRRMHFIGVWAGTSAEGTAELYLCRDVDSIWCDQHLLQYLLQLLVTA